MPASTRTATPSIPRWWSGCSTPPATHWSRCDPDDWHPATGEDAEAWKELDWQDTIESRRRWYLSLREEGMV
jgi:hypothetical protein